MFKIKVTGYKRFFLLHFVSYFYLYIAPKFTIFMMKKSKMGHMVCNCCDFYSTGDQLMCILSVTENTDNSENAAVMLLL